MKKADLVTSILLVPLDYVMLFAAGMSSYALRYQGFITRYRPVFFDYPLTEFVPSLLGIAALGVIIFALNGAYKVGASSRALEVFGKVFLGVSTTILLVIVSVFLKREFFSSRFVVVFAWVTAVLYVFIARMLVQKVKTALIKRGIGTHYLVLVGNNKTTDDIATYFRAHPGGGYTLVDHFASFDQSTREKILKLKEQKKVDEILDTEDNTDKDILIDVVNFCHRLNINFRHVASLYQTKIMNIETDSIAGYPIIQINKTPLYGWGRVYKRLTDIVFSLLALIVAAPVSLCIALLIKLDSRGPIFVRLTRVGRTGNFFTLYKFRSMITNAHELKPSMMTMNERAEGPLFKIKNDPRITRVGKLLRRSSLDEIPQLWNVLKGQMSLVGPRPHEPEEVKQYREEYKNLLSIKPGLTGMAQVSGRSNLLFDEEAKIDIYYIENWSLHLDFHILLKTLIVIFKFSDAA